MPPTQSAGGSPGDGNSPMRSILITGASRGIGLMLVRHYLAEGRHVIGCSRTPSPVPAEPGQGRYGHFQVDITDEHAVRSMMGSIRRQLGGFGTLVNNAGLFSAELGLLASAASLERVLATNVVGNFIVTREALKMMKAAGFGRVINISSIAVPIEETGNSFYAASKIALHRITSQMARELPGTNITVNTVGVSFIQGGSMYERMKPEALERYRRRMLNGAPITVMELAYAIDFFVDDARGALNGQALYFGGPS